MGRFPSRALFKLIATTLAMLFVPGLIRAQSPAGSQPKTPADWLTRAADLSDIRAPGSPAFTLRGHVFRADSNAGGSAGTYRLDWNSADQWREEIDLPGYHRLRIGGANRYWEQSSNYPPPLAATFLDELLDFPLRLRPGADSRLGQVEERTSRRGIKIDCVTESSIGTHQASEFCFDSSSGELVEDGTPPHIDTLEDTYVTARVYTSFVSWSGKKFPMELSAWDGDQKLFGFILDELVPLEQGKVDRFSAPAGAEEWTVCGQAKPARFLNYRNPSIGLAHDLRSILFYGVVEPNGLLSHVVVADATDPDYAADAMQALAGWKPGAAQCGGSSIREPAYITVHMR